MGQQERPRRFNALLIGEGKGDNQKLSFCFIKTGLRLQIDMLRTFFFGFLVFVFFMLFLPELELFAAVFVPDNRLFCVFTLPHRG